MNATTPRRPSPDTTPSGHHAQLLLDQRCTLGEGPCWDPASLTLLWVDIEQMRIHRLNQDGAVNSMQLDRHVGAVAPRASGGLVAAIADGFALLNQEGRLERLIPVEADQPQHRMNDAKVDPHGRLWAGTTHQEFIPGTGALYRLDPDGAVERVADGFALANGLDWTPDGEQMYFIDSTTRRVDIFDVDQAAGHLRNRRPFVTLPDQYGLPDGLTVDAHGNVWVACWDGSAVLAWNPDGHRIAEIAVPTPRVTSCAFGGPSLDQLYITTAAGSEPSTAPGAGGLFVAQPGATGRPREAFRG